MKYGLRFGVILLLAIAGLAAAMFARHGARADVDNTTAISCIFFSAVLSPADACDGLDAQDIQIIADTTGDEDGTLERTDLVDLDLDANQITEASAAPSPWLSTIYVIAFVDDDGVVNFDADVGGNVAINDDGMFDESSPADDANIETCEGDDDADCGTSTPGNGDGVVVATITTSPFADPGDLVDVDVSQGGSGGTETLTVVGAPDEVDLTLVENNVRVRETGSDCASGDPLVTDPEALSNVDSTLALAVVTDSDGTPLTRIVAIIRSDDSDIAEIGDTTVVTVDARESGIASITVICGGDDTGTANISVDIGGEDDSAPISVTGDPANIALTASPAAIDCDGDDPATVTATVVDENGNPVANGTPVTFSVVAFGVADPVNATTFDGAASSSIYPAGGNNVGITVLVSSGLASAFIRIDCGAQPPSPPSGPPRAIQLKATPDRIDCNGNEPSRIRVRVLDDNDQPVLNGTYVEFMTEGDGYGWFSEQQVATSNGVATTDVWFQAYDPAFPPYAFDVRATAGMLSGSIRVYCDEPSGCVSPPVSPPVDPLSPPCEPPLTPTPVPPDCERGNSGRIVSPPCNEPGRPLSPPRCDNNGRGQGRGNQQCATPTPTSPPECAVSPPPGSVSPPCATPTTEPPSPPPCEWPFSPPGCGLVPCSLDTSVSPPVFECAFSPTATASATPTTTPTATRTPLPARMALDCDVEIAGTQEACGPLPDGTSSTDVAIVLENLTNAPIFIWSLDARVASPADGVLNVIPGSGSLDNNPDFNQDDLGSEWGCNIWRDRDSSDVVSPMIECFNFLLPVTIGANTQVTLATVHYDFGRQAAGATGHVDLVAGSVATFEGHILADCSACASIEVQLPAIIPFTTTPTPTAVPEEPHAPAIESSDATSTPSNTYFAALDCDLNKLGLQDRCTYGLDAGAIDIGFVIFANVEECTGSCDLAAFNFVVTDPDRSRLDPPPGDDGNLDANPDFYQALLTQIWFCLPPPPDNNRLPDDSPQAESFLSCFASVTGAPLGPHGSLRAASIHYTIPDTATAGEVTLSLSGLSVGDLFGNELIGCPTAGSVCRPATITLVDTSAATNTPVPTATPTSNRGIIPISITDTPTPVPTATPTPNGSGLMPLATCADVTDDGVVSIEDAVAITAHVGKRDERYDITRDGKTNVKDVLAAVRQLKRTC